MKEELTQTRLKELLAYCEKTGEFAWNADRNRVSKGDKAGYLNCKNYLEIRICGGLYRSHRLAWLYVYGDWPAHQVDHINGNKSDNRIANLREATNAQNHQNLNGKNGALGTNWHKERCKWRATIMVNGKSKYLGLFETQLEAHRAYCEEKSKLHTFSPSVGFCI